MIDTGVLVHMERKLARFSIDALGARNELSVSAVTISELLVGAHGADTAARRDARFAFADRVAKTLTVVPFTLQTAQVHGGLAADLQARGQMIGAHDLIIAATALEHGHSVLTTNRGEFERVQGLTVIEFPLTT